MIDKKIKNMEETIKCPECGSIGKKITFKKKNQ